MMNCKECGNIISENDKVCTNCGCLIEEMKDSDDNKKDLDAVKNLATERKGAKKTKFIIISVLAIIIVGVCIYIIPLQLSSRNFIKAQQYEEILDYENAVSYYSKVIKRDNEDYKVAIEKIKELNKEIEAYKGGALAIKALNNQFQVGFKNVKGFYYSSNNYGYKYYIEIGNDKYEVSSEKKEPVYLLSDVPAYTKVFFDNETSLNIVLYEAEFMYNGFVTDDTNTIRQGTSDTLFDTEILYAKSMNLKLIEKYLK